MNGDDGFTPVNIITSRVAYKHKKNENATHHCKRGSLAPPPVRYSALSAPRLRCARVYYRLAAAITC